MRFWSSLLQPAFAAQGEDRYVAYSFATDDPFEQVIAPDYFKDAQRKLKPGDLIFVGTEPPADRRKGPSATGRIRRALLMVSVSEPGHLECRVVQDFGTPAGPVPEPANPPAGETNVPSEPVPARVHKSRGVAT
jgi:hypothetical protein